MWLLPNSASSFREGFANSIPMKHTTFLHFVWKWLSRTQIYQLSSINCQLLFLLLCLEIRLNTNQQPWQYKLYFLLLNLFEIYSSRVRFSVLAISRSRFSWIPIRTKEVQRWMCLKTSGRISENSKYIWTVYSLWKVIHTDALKRKALALLPPMTTSL